MTWLAITEHDQHRFSLRGLGADKRAKTCIADKPDALLTRGTLLFETHPTTQDHTQPLFGYMAHRPYKRGLCFEARAGGGVAITRTQGGQTDTTEIRRTDEVRRDVLRVTYSWDAPARWACLTLEQPEETQVLTVIVPDPVPLSLGDLRRMMLGGAGQTFAPEMIFAALSDQVEPVGPMPTLLPQTPIATPWGFTPLGQLQRGDTVHTRLDGVAPVIHSVERTVPARGSFQPLRLRAPYFGLEEDVIVAPEQRLLIGGPEVEYLFGQEAVLVPARHLVNGFTAHPEPMGPLVTYHQLVLPRHETLNVAGAHLESLHIGRLRRQGDLVAKSVLAHADRAGLPEHGRPCHQVLRQFEAIHLARKRAA